jgi:hypothetical protein
MTIQKYGAETATAQRQEGFPCKLKFLPQPTRPEQDPTSTMAHGNYRTGGLLALISNEVAQNELGRRGKVHVGAFSKYLAVNLNPSKICACANVSHRVGNLEMGL